MTQLLSVEPSGNPKKKWSALFLVDDKLKLVDFGLANADDYTLTHDKAQRDRYRKRHQKDLKTNDVTRPGYLSYFLLWGDSTDINKNIAAYRKLFGI
jgi:hypothetical protein